MLPIIASQMYPEGYHGRGQRRAYFEGWYFKLVDAGGQHRYAIIPGISLGERGGGPHSFVQVLDGVSGQTVYRRYPVSAFSARERTLDVRVGPNRFSWRGMELDLQETEIPLRGNVRFDRPKPWPVTLASPGIMGWYAWVPRMECYHGVLSLDHGLSGSLSAGSASYDFRDGRGYIEKDWGQSFPSGWVWTQSNHFSTPGVCLTASIAMIPWIGRAFPGFIIGLYRHGTLYRFATYTGARTTHLAVADNEMHWTVEDALYRLEISGRRATVGRLRGPSRVDMGRPVPETLSATVDVRMVARHTGATLFEDTGRYAGMEIGGDVAPLLTAPARMSESSAW